MSIAWVLDIAIAAFSLYSIDLIGIYGNLLFYAGICFAIGVYLIFEMAETRGLTREEIKALFMHGRKTIEMIDFSYDQDQSNLQN